MRDGTVFPHDRTVSSTNPKLFDSAAFNDIALRVGEVFKVHYPDDLDNQSKKVTEYTVKVQYRQGNGSSVNRFYHATICDLFGTQGDSFRYTLRPSTTSKTGQSLADGARVLLACPNGETNAAVIISGVRHTDAKPDPLKAAGDYLNFQFNGTQVQINDAGELSLVVPGSTNNDGTPESSSNKGKIDVTTGGDATIHADGDARLEAKKNLRLGSAGASEPLVLGNQLVAALTALIQVLTTTTPFGAVGPLPVGPPVTMSAPMFAALNLWSLQYLQVPLPPFLASNKFTEQ